MPLSGFWLPARPAGEDPGLDRLDPFRSISFLERTSPLSRDQKGPCRGEPLSGVTLATVVASGFDQGRPSSDPRGLEGGAHDAAKLLLLGCEASSLPDVRRSG